jgi:hypothetical protein
MKTEPNKLEQEIKEKLEGRTITPRPMAWDRLDAMLTVAEGGAQKPAKKHNRAWLYMAACLLAMLSVGGLLLHKGKGGIDTPNVTKGVVNSNSKESKTHTNTNAGTTPQLQPQTQQNAAQGIAGVQKGSSSTSKNNQQQQYKTGTLTTTQVYAAPGFDPAEPTPPQMVTQTATNQGIKVDAGALLASVQTQKPQAAKATSPGIKVNANALLMDIEGDMEMNFRDRMFSKIAKGYGEVKEAVVTRNYN